MVPPCDASLIGVRGDHACDPNHPWCASPTYHNDARDQWEACNAANLDYQTAIAIPKLTPCVQNLSARQRVEPHLRAGVVAAKMSDIGGILSANPLKLAVWRQTYGVFDSTLLLHQESLDQLQDRFGRALQQKRFFDLVKVLGGRLVFISPGYSVYDDGTMCPLRQVLNLRRSLLEAARANRAGFASIPTLGWSSQRAEDLDFVATWLRRQNGKVRVLAINAQTGKSSDSLALALGAGMREIENRTGLSYRWVVFGGRRRVDLISEFIPRNRITQVSRPKDFTEINLPLAHDPRVRVIDNPAREQV